jgi:serine O-acetyltransferase
LLGNITIGDNARIGSNATVLEDVPAGQTVIGYKGKVLYKEQDYSI